VTDLFKNFDLSRYPVDVFLVFNFVLLQYLDSDLLACEFVHAQFDVAKGALAQRFA